MASHTGNTPLTDESNSNGEIFFNQPKSLKKVLDRYVRQRNTFLATTVLLFIACIVLLVCFIVIKHRETDDSRTNVVCNTLGCITNSAGRRGATFMPKVDLYSSRRTEWVFFDDLLIGLLL